MALQPTSPDSHGGMRRGSPDTPTYTQPDDVELPPPPIRPTGRSSSRDDSWPGMGALGTGIIIGTLIGVGAALFLAPQTGRALRAQLRRRGRRMRDRSEDVFEALRDELRLASREKRRAIRRKLRKLRYAAEDTAEDARRKAEA